MVKQNLTNGASSIAVRIANPANMSGDEHDALNINLNLIQEDAASIAAEKFLASQESNSIAIVTGAYSMLAGATGLMGGALRGEALDKMDGSIFNRTVLFKLAACGISIHRDSPATEKARDKAQSDYDAKMASFRRILGEKDPSAEQLADMAKLSEDVSKLYPDYYAQRIRDLNIKIRDTGKGKAREELEMARNALAQESIGRTGWKDTARVESLRTSSGKLAAWARDNRKELLASCAVLKPAEGRAMFARTVEEAYGSFLVVDLSDVFGGRRKGAGKSDAPALSAIEQAIADEKAAADKAEKDRLAEMVAVDSEHNRQRREDIVAYVAGLYDNMNADEFTRVYRAALAEMKKRNRIANGGDIPELNAAIDAVDVVTAPPVEAAEVETVEAVA